MEAETVLKMPANMMETRLKEACQLTGACWSARLESGSDRWVVEATYNLDRNQRGALLHLLKKSPMNNWLTGALAGKPTRSRTIPSEAATLGIKIFVFPDRMTQRAILVGAENLTPAARRFWQFLGSGDSSHSILGITALRGIENQEPGIPFYFPPAFEQILSTVLQPVNNQGGWLAVRSGDVFEIKGAINCPDFIGKRISIEANPVLRELNQDHLARLINKGQLEWAMVPRTGFKTNTRIWAALPLVIGQRLIGLIGLWGVSKFQPDEWEQLKQASFRVSPSVEASITFADLTNHLQRMALLNDFAITVSSAFELEQIAQRVFALLQRAFDTDRIILFVLSSDGRNLSHYFGREGKVILQTQPVDSEPIHWPMEKGEIFRTEKITPDSEYKPVYPDSSSAVLVPLKYRRQLIGALGLESQREGAFAIYDEHLLVVIASHLSGLIENGRLRQEAEVRARNLSLIHEVVEHVIGLTDVRQVAQITSELLARNFAYELATVALFEMPDGLLKLYGIGGSAADVVKQGLRYVAADPGGITKRVAMTGQSMRVSDVSLDPVYCPIPGWEAGSELCVALRQGDQILGVIDVESQQKNAFTQNDLLLLESLAGVLASVISNVVQYQKLQATVDQLQTAREELQERIAAQRIAESRLVQAAKLVAVGEMAAGIAHELNNPLTTVSGFVELVMNELPKESTAHDDLELVLREANRARGVVRRLLDFSRQSDSTRIRADINEIVNDVLALVNHLLQTSGIRATTNLGKQLPWVSVDRNQIKQIILNLIHNAMHAMPQGGQLFINTELQKRDNREWLITRVRDTGIGITPENLERVFEPFFTTRSKEGGTGLGLSVSYGIAADHGGFIDVESEIGKGSSFTVWLPVEAE